MIKRLGKQSGQEVVRIGRTRARDGHSRQRSFAPYISGVGQQSGHLRPRRCGSLRHHGEP